LPWHTEWNTDGAYMSNLYLHKQYIGQVIEHGRSEDIAAFDFAK